MTQNKILTKEDFFSMYSSKPKRAKEDITMKRKKTALDLIELKEQAKDLGCKIEDLL